MDDRKTTYGLNDICERYGVGINKAHEIIRRIEYVNDGLMIGKQSILWSEVQYYEVHRGRKPGDPGIATREDIDRWDAARNAV